MLIEDKVEGLQGNLMKVCSTPRDCYSMRTASFDQCETSHSSYRTEFNLKFFAIERIEMELAKDVLHAATLIFAMKAVLYQITMIKWKFQTTHTKL